MHEIKKLEIDRAKWLNYDTDETLGSSTLCNAAGSMCCLGFLSLAIGLKRSDIEGQYGPNDLDFDDIPHMREEGSDTMFATQAIIVNDGFRYTPESREERLISVFEHEGIELTFTGKAPNGPQED